jgi:hypothetical protein
MTDAKDKIEAEARENTIHNAIDEEPEEEWNARVQIMMNDWLHQQLCYKSTFVKLNNKITVLSDNLNYYIDKTNRLEREIIALEEASSRRFKLCMQDNKQLKERMDALEDRLNNINQ